MSAIDIFENHSLWAVLTAWFLAQVLKIPVHYFTDREWN